jgi:hypothetical protein
MSTAHPPHLRLKYANAAEAYLRSLPPEHFMEATAQGTQRKITLASMDLVHADQPAVQVFNELLVQYPFGRHKTVRQVVPDNMLVVHPEPIDADGSYDLPFQPVGPFLMMEYVSKHNKRKDYEDNYRRCERELKVPYYLLFYPDNQELSLFHLRGRRYVSVKANEHGRYPIPELHLEVAILDGWVRYWYKGKLLPLPSELQREVEELRRQLAEERRQLAEERQRLAEEQQRRAEEKRRADELQQQLLATQRELAKAQAQLARAPKRPRNGG